MKVIETKSNTLTSGDMPTIDMGISDNQEDQLMILNVLSNTLYTNKIAAVLREYGCNAFDANVEAGNGTVPIEVRLPNKLEATCSIRDYGFGMTQDQIANTFCRLGRSTKRNSNDFTGMLGIGSKAGFAYGDSFVVTSYTKGVMCVYNAFRDKGAPRLAKMFEGLTKERDGIEIKIPVRIADVEAFAREAKTTYQYFKVPPKITGQQVDLSRPDVILDGPKWRFVGGGASTAIMGNVGYRLDPASLGTGYGDRLYKLLECGIELDFEIGELEISANREGLQYKDTTNRSIKALFDSISADMASRFSKQIAQAKTLWDAKILYGKIFERTGDHHQSMLREAISGDIKWNGITITSSNVDVSSARQKPGVISVASYNNSRSWIGRGKYDKNLHLCRFRAGEEVQLYINDLPGQKGSPARLNTFFATAPLGSTMILLAFADAKAKDAFFKQAQMEGAPTSNFSSIIPTYTTGSSNSGPSAHRAKHSARGFELDESLTCGKHACSGHWKNVDIDKKGTGVYVRIDKFCVTPPKNSSNSFGIGPWLFTADVKRLRESGLLDVPVHGIKADLLSKLGPGWVPLDKYLETRLNAMSHGKFVQEFSDYWVAIDFPVLIEVKPKEFGSGTSIHKLLKEHQRMLAPADFAVIELLKKERASTWIKAPKPVSPTVDLEAMRDQVFADYPMIHAVWKGNDGFLRSLSNRGNGKFLTSLTDYIKLVDGN